MELPNCGIDRYRVLRLSPLMEAIAIEAEYQKLVSLLQPIKNDFPGTRLALNFVEDAFSVLSDPVKRAAFDSKRNGVGNNFYDMDFKVQCSDGLKSGNETAVDVARCCSDKPGSSRTKRTAYDACVGIGSVSPVAEDYADEKRKKICSEELCCITAKMRSEEGNDLHSNLEEGGHIWWQERDIIPTFMTSRTTRRLSFSPRARPCPQKRWCDAGLPVACGSFALESTKITVSPPAMFSHLLSNGKEKQSIEVHPQKGVKVACLVKVDGHKSVFQRYSKRGNESSFQIPVNKLFTFSHNVPAFRFVGGEMDGIANVMIDSGGSNVRIQNHKPKWSSKDFVTEQIWARYDGPDAMPRLYVRLNDVISPTTVRVTYLEPHPVRDEEIQWVEESLPMACGIFRAGRATADLEMSRFSHLVKCGRSSKKSFYRIYPRKGEIWAMYKNWNSNWKNSDHVGCQCRVVEILSDFSEETGINICSLVEAKGCYVRGSS
ncbi:hypothetical protein COCNU_11G003530 [Cocos nucifera]|uniref:DNAJ heat shock N-terminal domain-containing protein n=1 Tax=Cocos nucifera TaxID=13894 RepID=A0A8K0INJ3_COCNU|nr:hypothetical protein COCNU_11G003530 [Cocos nucifera]